MFPLASLACGPARGEGFAVLAPDVIVLVYSVVFGPVRERNLLHCYLPHSCLVPARLGLHCVSVAVRVKR
jgi:hypothetical protein